MQDSCLESASEEMCKFKVPTVRRHENRILNLLGPTCTLVTFKRLGQVDDFCNTRDIKPRCENAWIAVEDEEKQGCWPEPEYPETVSKN